MEESARLRWAPGGKWEAVHGAEQWTGLSAAGAGRVGGTRTWHPHLVWGWQRALGEDVFWKCPALQGTQLLLAFLSSSGKRNAWPARVSGQRGPSCGLPLCPLDGPLPDHPLQSVVCSIFPDLRIARASSQGWEDPRTLHHPSFISLQVPSVSLAQAGRRGLGPHHGHNPMHPAPFKITRLLPPPLCPQ